MYIRYILLKKLIPTIKADKKTGVKKFAAAGFKTLSQNGQVILSFAEPVDIFIEKKNKTGSMTIADGTKTSKPLINKL